LVNDNCLRFDAFSCRNLITRYELNVYTTDFQSQKFSLEAYIIIIITKELIKVTQSQLYNCYWGTYMVRKLAPKTGHSSRNSYKFLAQESLSTSHR